MFLGNPAYFFLRRLDNWKEKLFLEWEEENLANLETKKTQT